MEQFSQPQQQVIRPDNNQLLAIISMIAGVFSCSLCCIGFLAGIIALILSSQVNKKFDYGDYSGAEAAAKNSKILSYIALGLTAISIIVVVIRIATGGFQEVVDAFQEGYREGLNR